MLRIPQLHRKNGNFKEFKFVSSRGTEGSIYFTDLGFEQTYYISMDVFEDNNDVTLKIIGTIPASYFPIDPETGNPLDFHIKILGIDYVGSMGTLLYDNFTYKVRLSTRSYHYGIQLANSLHILKIFRANNFFDNTTITINV